MSKSDNYLLLKWGTVKGWSFESEDNECWKLLKKYLKDMPVSSAMDRPCGDKKDELCNIIDKFEGEIQNDWTGEYLTKEEAKEYVMNYNK